MFRIATYNIRKCVGLDWRRRPDRVMTVLRELHADVVALQEADRRFGERRATLSAAALAAATGLRPVELPAPRPSSGHHGNALLVRGPAEVRRVLPLDLPSLEPRGALVAEIALGGARLRVAAVHLGLRPADRRRQARALLATLGGLGDGMPTIVLGDINEWQPEGPATAELAQAFEPSHPLASFHSTLPVAPLDRIFIGPGLGFRHVAIHRSPAALRASDHLPLFADLEFHGAAGEGAPQTRQQERSPSTT